MRGWVLGLLVLVGTAGCSGGRADQEASPSASQTSGAQASTAESSTVPPPPPPPPPPGPPVVGPGPCPYLEQGYVEETVGQRMGRVETVAVEGQPAPDCVFYRPDDRAAVTIDLTLYADPVAAQNAALVSITPAAMPITDIGDYGGVLITPGQTLLAVTSGPLLLVVITNQETSLQARELATTVLAALG